MIEGDDRHSPQSREKMRRGIALTDADRQGWLQALAQDLQAQPTGTVLTCSALRLSYREQLRKAVLRLRFVFIDITPEAALARVAARPSHFFSSRLVDSQFATLESPIGETDVLRVDAALSIEQQRAQVCTWLHAQETA